MSNSLSIFHEIFFLGLRPWMNRDWREDKYKELFQAETQEVFNHQPLYKIVFNKPLNAKRKYYYLLATNGTIHFLNDIKTNIDDALNDNEKKYIIIQQALKPLSQKLKEINTLIEERNYQWDAIKGTAQTTKSDSNVADEAYIFQLIKYHLLSLYLEIQNVYLQFLKDDAYTDEELHQKFFTEAIFQTGIITNADNIHLPTPASQVKADPNAKTFERKAFDFRDPKKGILSYDKIIRNEQRFSAFEEELFTHNIIDANFNFIDAHGNKQLLAAAIHTAISKKYFSERNFEKKTPLKQVDIRKFIDHRYNASIDKQFRTWGNDANALAQFLDNHFWITNLPVG